MERFTLAVGAVHSTCARIAVSNCETEICPLESHSRPFCVMLLKSDMVMWIRGRRSCRAGHHWIQRGRDA